MTKNKINQQGVIPNEMVAKNEELKEPQDKEQERNQKEDIFSTEEIKIEEMAIDGICGVY